MAARIAVLADIHGNLPALTAVLTDVRRREITRLVNLGDSFYGPLWPRETFATLLDAAMKMTIAGNVDRLLHQARPQDLVANPTLAFVIDELGPEPISWTESLPPTASLDGQMFLCHGSPASDTTYLLEDVSTGRAQVLSDSEIRERLGNVGEPVVLCAHSHVPRAVHLSTGQLVVNPGSVGLPAYDQPDPDFHVMESYAPHACYAILESSERGWNATHLRLTYDWEQAASRAASLGREDWAHALRTGRMARSTT